MDRVDMINNALNAMHRSEKGLRVKSIAAKLGISTVALLDKRKRKYHFHESEYKTIFEDLKLPLEA